MLHFVRGTQQCSFKSEDNYQDFLLNSSIFRQKWTKTELNYELTKFVQQLIYIYIHKTVTYVSALVSDW